MSDVPAGFLDLSKLTLLHRLCVYEDTTATPPKIYIVSTETPRFCVGAMDVDDAMHKASRALRFYEESKWRMRIR